MQESNMEGERRYLPNADPSEDWDLKVFLDDITEEISKSDYERIKFFVTGEFGVDEKRLENCNGPLDLFQCLMKCRKISRSNLLYLQNLIWHIKRKDLMEKFVKFSQENDKKPLYFFMPSEEPVNGYRHVNVHVRGGIGNLTNEEKEKQRHQLSRLLCIPLQFVLLDGSQPSNSILLTFMVPEISIEIFKSLKPTIEGISVEFVEDVLTIREIPLENKEPKDEKTELEKEVKHWREKEKRMKQELDLTLTQLLETEEELHLLKEQIPLQDEQSVDKKIPLEKQEGKDEITELGKQKEDLEIEEKIPLEKQEGKDEKTEFGKPKEDLEMEEKIPLENQEPKDEKTEWEKEVKYWMEKEKTLKEELDLTSTQLLETKKELLVQKEQIWSQAKEMMYKVSFKKEQQISRLEKDLEVSEKRKKDIQDQSLQHREETEEMLLEKEEQIKRLQKALEVLEKRNKHVRDLWLQHCEELEKKIPLEKPEPKDEKTEVEKEVKHWMEKENKIKQELDLTSTQLLETKKELLVQKEQIWSQAKEMMYKDSNSAFFKLNKFFRKEERTQLEESPMRSTLQMEEDPWELEEFQWIRPRVYFTSPRELQEHQWIRPRGYFTSEYVVKENPIIPEMGRKHMKGEEPEMEEEISKGKQESRHEKRWKTL